MKPSTSRILLNKALGRACDAECVDWAVGLLMNGTGGGCAARLAGMMPPFNPFELADLRDRTLAEVGATDVDPGSSAVLIVLADAMDAAIDDPETLLDLVEIGAELYLTVEPSDILQRFYLLKFARLELQHDTHQWYWDGATRENIDDIIRSEARLFIGSIRN